MFVGVDLEWLVTFAVFIAARFGQKLSVLRGFASTSVRGASRLPSALLSFKVSDR